MRDHFVGRTVRAPTRPDRGPSAVAAATTTLCLRTWSSTTTIATRRSRAKEAATLHLPPRVGWSGDWEPGFHRGEYDAAGIRFDSGAVRITRDRDWSGVLAERILAMPVLVGDLDLVADDLQARRERYQAPHRLLGPGLNQRGTAGGAAGRHVNGARHRFPIRRAAHMSKTRVAGPCRAAGTRGSTPGPDPGDCAQESGQGTVRRGTESRLKRVVAHLHIASRHVFRSAQQALSSRTRQWQSRAAGAKSARDGETRPAVLPPPLPS